MLQCNKGTSCKNVDESSPWQAQPIWPEIRNAIRCLKRKYNSRRRVIIWLGATLQNHIPACRSKISTPNYIGKSFIQSQQLNPECTHTAWLICCDGILQHLLILAGSFTQHKIKYRWFIFTPKWLNLKLLQVGVLGLVGLIWFGKFGLMRLILWGFGKRLIGQ